jgi:hypothetical protein
VQITVSSLPYSPSWVAKLTNHLVALPLQILKTIKKQCQKVKKNNKYSVHTKVETHGETQVDP